MVRLIVGERSVPSGLRGRLAKAMTSLAERGITASIREDERPESVFYTCVADVPEGRAIKRLPHSNRTKSGAGYLNIFVEHIAQAIAETVIHDIEPDLLFRSLRGLNPAYGAVDAARIMGLAQHELEQVELSGGERALIAARVEEHFRFESRLHVDGFVRFRLKGYRDELLRCLQKAISTFEAEEEHREFVKLLRYFIQDRDSAVDHLHVLPNGGGFRLVDSDGSAVDGGSLEDYVVDLAEGGTVDQGDLLISTLVSIVPKKVICHFARTNWDTSLLDEIFEDRIVHCRGCAMCSGRPEKTADTPKG